MKTLFRFAWVLAPLVLSACVGDSVRIPNAGPLPERAQQRELNAEACGFQLLLLIPVQVNGRQNRAYHDLVAQANGDALTNVRVQERWSFGLVGTMYCTEMQATAVHLMPAPAASTAPVPAMAPPAPVAPAAAPETPAPGTAAPAVAPAVPAMAPAAPPAPSMPATPLALTAGGHAKLRPGAIVHNRATPDGSAVALPADATLDLKSSMNNASGGWWYVVAPSGSGWARTQDLDPQP